MRDCIRELCVLSLFLGAALSLCPEGGTKRVLRLFSTAALLALILNAAGRLDLSAYPLDLALYREREMQLAERGEELRQEMNRLVIEQEYAAYIQDKAASMGIALRDVRIGVRWSSEGVWIPESSSIGCEGDAERSLIGTVLESELGIAAERQVWLGDG